jgi:hypothetical protein
MNSPGTSVRESGVWVTSSGSLRPSQV